MLAVASDGRVLDANPAACTFFGLSREGMTRTKLAELVGSDGRAQACDVAVRREVVPGVDLVVVRDGIDRPSLQAHLRRTDRLSTFGLLAVGVAHEINNPLMYAMTNLRAALRRMPELTEYARRHARDELAEALEQCRRMLATADEGLHRIETLVRDLRVSSREGEQREPVDLRQVLESALNIAHGEIRQRARVVRDYAEDAIVEGNPARLGQVFLNLLVNAAQAMPADATPASPAKNAEIRIVTRGADEGRVAVEISDNGAGIAPENIARIFEPFFTTKAAVEGTGLGLYIAHAIVREHGGSIEAESTLGKGTTVRVLLPVARSAPETTTAPTAPR